MKKNQLILLFSFCCLCGIQAQTADPKDKRISELEVKVTLLSKEVDYYKETLKLMNSNVEATEGNVTFKINSVTGDKASGKVKIEGIAVNGGDVRTLQPQSALSYDPQGNETTIYEMTLGTSGRIEKFERDVPVKFSVEYTNVPVDTPVFTMVKISFFSTLGFNSDDIQITYRNLPIVWR
ncbi:MAG: hypothetical protein Q4G63_12675 [Bacteroidia bacterium]|nr:hypothetical protein [Bacteroidia bacterium]